MITETIVVFATVGEYVFMYFAFRHYFNSLPKQPRTTQEIKRT